MTAYGHALGCAAGVIPCARYSADRLCRSMPRDQKNQNGMIQPGCILIGPQWNHACGSAASGQHAALNDMCNTESFEGRYRRVSSFYSLASGALEKKRRRPE